MKNPELNTDSEQLDIVTRLITSMLIDYNRAPTFQVVAPHVSLLELWLQGEVRRRERIGSEDRVRVHDSPT